MVGKQDLKLPAYERATALFKCRLETIKRTVDALAVQVEPLTQVQIRSLSAYAAEITRKQAEFEANFQRILEAVSSDEASDSKLSEDQDSVNDLYVHISSVIDTLTPAVEQTTSSGDSVSSCSLNSAAASVRLPKLELKRFCGDPLSWVSFINLFDTTIHKNAGLSNVTKMQYLISVLSDEPLNLVKSLNISSANYLIAYNLLRERYHSTRRLTTLHLNQIMDLPNISSTHTTGLRTFLNIYHEHSQALRALDCDISSGSNPLLSALVLRKMDGDLRKKLECFRATHAETHSLPEVSEIIKFLTAECSQTEDANLHMTQVSSSKVNSNAKQSTSKPLQHTSRFSPSNKSVAFLSTNSNFRSHPPSHNCFACNKEGHKIYKCSLFLSKTPSERASIVKQAKRCYSCLGAHMIETCSSRNLCITCNKRHHTLLHFEKKTAPALATQATQQVVASTQSNSPSPALSDSTVLLGTALVKLTSPNGHSLVFRALLDSGSQISFISERAAQLLGAPRTNSTLGILGISTTTSKTKGFTTLDLASLSGNKIAANHPFHILNRISADLPRTAIKQEVWQLTRSYVLADPTFHLPGSVDVLVGGALYPLLLTHHHYSLGPDLPHMIGTQLGYVVMGNAPCEDNLSPASHVIACHSAAEPNDLHSSLQRFWTQEELPSASLKSMEEQLCDQHFSQTHSRTTGGRYVVSLPFKPDSPALGYSQQIAKNRLVSLERKFQNQPQLHKLYVNFMRGCEASEHMIKVNDIDLTTKHCFLPHHGVVKLTGDSEKIRVVYDASCKTSSGTSLNDTLLTGPKLQTNICDILIRFRTHNIVITCDIRQMYLQILVHPSDQMYQLVLWRETPSEPLSIYKLTRVTFGVNSSPYLAIRTLHQLAEDEGQAFPEAAEVLKTQTYVDDIITGADNVEDARKLQAQLIQLLNKGGFELHKWISNSPELLNTLPEAHRETPAFLEGSTRPQYTILGLQWSPTTDSFTYNINWPVTPPTKRRILSLVAQIYDPCGYLSPFIMLTKCFMQLLWSTGKQWDEPLPPDLTKKWQTIVSDTRAISNITIPRALHIHSGTNIELHGFSDASECGFAAVVYMKCQRNSDDVTVRLLLSKTRVAPLKRVTIPRLELCGAHLLAQLMTYCRSLFNLTLNQCHLWCDSSVVLTWLQTPSYRLKTYVANRVSQTQEIIPSHCWRYIPSQQNPADCASRGLLASQLQLHPLWWTGPEWLQLPQQDWPSSRFTAVDISLSEETKPTPLTVLHSTQREQWDLLLKFSNWCKLQRVMAFVLRFVSNCRTSTKCHGSLSVKELQSAKMHIFKLIQQESFPEEIRLIKKKQPCSAKLQRLAPFLDSKDVLRVGGRLRAANVSDDVRHPIILPKSNHITNLFIDYCHQVHLHSGPQLTQALLATEVWILSARSVIRSRIFKCLKCFKAKPRNKYPLMADLPQSRVTPARPFLHTGIDYAGPFNVRVVNLRAMRHVKIYFCTFVCLVTKAVHLEVVTDLTTEAFIATLTRFVSRRGLCSDIYSDCGTNFVGADAALRKIVKSTLYASQEQIQHFTASKGIHFHFNPPAAPHQGGLWESCVKSVKYHLRRVMGDTVLNFFQFVTLITQIEGMLNSRPLTPLSNDPADLTALTPGHFLIGAPLTTVPEVDFQDVPVNRLNGWQQVQAFHQRIWQRWHMEYLHTLQQRSKWSHHTENLQVGDLVLVHCTSPPSSWPLARVTAVHPGSDGVVRVVDLKTASGHLTRPAVKVFRLPVDSNLTVNRS